jgi:hypothetical protein
MANDISNSPTEGSAATDRWRWLHALADGAERWMVDSGLLDQLAFLVAKTGLARQLVLAGASSIFGVGAVSGNLAETLVSAAVVVLVGTVNLFIGRVRAKYAERLQRVVGAEPDRFIGPETVAQAAALASRDARAIHLPDGIYNNASANAAGQSLS